MKSEWGLIFMELRFGKENCKLVVLSRGEDGEWPTKLNYSINDRTVHLNDQTTQKVVATGTFDMQFQSLILREKKGDVKFDRVRK